MKATPSVGHAGEVSGNMLSEYPIFARIEFGLEAGNLDQAFCFGGEIQEHLSLGFSTGSGSRRFPLTLTMTWRPGAEVGYHPKKPGRPSHHPLVAFL